MLEIQNLSLFKQYLQGHLCLEYKYGILISIKEIDILILYSPTHIMLLENLRILVSNTRFNLVPRVIGTDTHKFSLNFNDFILITGCVCLKIIYFKSKENTHLNNLKLWMYRFVHAPTTVLMNVLVLISLK